MHRLLQIRARKNGPTGRRHNRPTDRFSNAGNTFRAFFGVLALATLSLGLTLTGAFGVSVTSLRTASAAPSTATALLPVSASSELLAIRAMERAGERFLALVGPDYQSRLLREKRSFGMSAGTGSPNGGGLARGPVVLLALNPDRSLSQRLLKPQPLRGALLRDLMPDRPVRSAADRALRVPGPNAQAVGGAGPDFTIEFICQLKRISSSAADASDASSSSLHRIIA